MAVLKYYDGSDWEPVASALVGPTGAVGVTGATGPTGSDASSGLVLINTTSFSGVNSVSAPNGTFSATYDNYLIKFNSLEGSANYLSVRLRASGSDDAAANYRAQQLDPNGAGVDASRVVNATNWDNQFLANSNFTNFCEMKLVNPFASKVTSGQSVGVRTSNGNITPLIHWIGLNTTTSYDSISFIATGITGSISIYGFSK
jgi:hypothetical protein